MHANVSVVGLCKGKLKVLKREKLIGSPEEAIDI